MRSIDSGWRRALWPGIAALVAVMGIGRFVYTPILPEMLADGALTLRAAGWVASANFVGYLVGALAASAIHGRVAQAWFARAGLAATVLALAAMAVLDGVAAWMALRFVAGAASAFTLVFVSTQVLERLSAIGESDRMIWLFSGVSLGIVASAVGVQAVVAAGVGWPAAWSAAAMLAAVFAALAWGPAGASRDTVVAPGGARAARPGAQAVAGNTGAGNTGAQAGAGTTGADSDARGTNGAAATAASSVEAPVTPTPGDAAAPPPAPRAFAAAVIAYGLFGLGYVIHATYLPAMVRAAGYPPSAAAWIWVLVGLAALPSTALWRRFARRYGTRAAIVACYALEGTTALVPLLAGDSIVGAAIAAAGLGATFIPITGLALPFVRGLDAARSARAIGVMTAAFGVGQIAGPVIAAYVADGRGFGGPSALSCVVLLVAAALMRPRFDAAR